MSLPEPGVPLSFYDIQGEFGGSTPISLSEYYGAAPGIPASGEISVSDFYATSSVPVEVRWCSELPVAANATSYLEQGYDDDLPIYIYQITDDLTLLAVSDQSVSTTKVIRLHLFESSGRDFPVVVFKSALELPTTMNCYAPEIVPKSDNRWFLFISSAYNPITHGIFYIIDYDGTDMVLGSAHAIDIIPPTGFRIQRIIPLTRNKFAFLMTDGKTEAGTGQSSIEIYVADIDDDGNFTNIGTSERLANAGLCMADALDERSLALFAAQTNASSLYVAKALVDASNNVTFSDRAIGSFPVTQLISEILVTKYGSELRATIKVGEPTNKFVMYNFTSDNAPVGVDDSDSELVDRQVVISDMEWDAFNSSVICFVPQSAQPNIYIGCMEITQSGFGEMTNRGVLDIPYPSLSEQFYRGFRYRHLLSPLYRAESFYAGGTDAFALWVYGVKDFHAPDITSTPVTDATVGSSYSYDVEATGDAPITFSLDTHPNGMTIDSASGVISWTPDAVQVGSNDVDVKASNSSGIDNQPFTITVADAPALSNMVLEVEISAGALDFEIICASTADEYDAVIDWGDGTTSEITDDSDPDLIHTYASAGTYAVEISGIFPNISMDASATFPDSQLMIKKVVNLGVVGLTFLKSAFKYCGLTDFTAGETETGGINSFESFLQGNGDLVNVDVNGLDTSSATSFYSMFRSCHSIVSLDLSSLDVSNATTFSNFCIDCSSLSDVNMAGWDTSKMTTISYMFNGCEDFTARTGIADFNIGVLSAGGGMLSGSSITTAEYDELLVNWQGQPHQQNVTIHFGNSMYTPGSAAETARQSLIDDDGWTISDDGPVP